MEETLKDLKERRSIRAYKPEQIKEEELQKILEAGTYAPTEWENSLRRLWLCRIKKQEIICRN